MKKPALLPPEYYRYMFIGIGLYLAWIFILELIIMVIVPVTVYKVYCFMSNQPIIEVKGKAIFITGCDSGIGQALAYFLFSQGFVVFAGCLDNEGRGAQELRTSSSNAIHIVKMDVTNDSGIKVGYETVKHICQEKGIILWGIVNNAGIDTMGPIELISMSEFKRISDVNLYGTVRVTKTFLPLLRQSKGRVINISSERGLNFRSLSSAYCISKAGVETFSNILRLEMAKFGIHVSIIEPGHFGAATDIISKSVVEWNRRHLTTELKNAADGVKRAHCQYEIDALFESIHCSREHGYPNAQPILTRIAHSLVDPKPRDRYLIGGTIGLFDNRMILCRLKPILPDKLMDFAISILM